MQTGGVAEDRFGVKNGSDPASLASSFYLRSRRRQTTRAYPKSVISGRMQRNMICLATSPNVPDHTRAPV
jgi:hypothetical protein